MNLKSILVKNKMKLGIIDAHGRFSVNSFLEAYTNSGIENDFADSIESFIEEFGTNQKYDGFLIHPPYGYFNWTVHLIRDNFPSVRFGLVTQDLGTSVMCEEVDDEVPAFDYNDVDGIKKYFTRTN